MAPVSFRSPPQSEGAHPPVYIQGSFPEYFRKPPAHHPAIKVHLPEAVLGVDKSLSIQKVVHVVGGGVNNRLLCRLTADITGKPVVAGPAEATAAGNVMVQALARGRVSSLDQVRRVIAASTPLQQYDPDPAADWDDAIDRFETVLTDDTVA